MMRREPTPSPEDEDVFLDSAGTSTCSIAGKLHLFFPPNLARRTGKINHRTPSSKCAVCQDILGTSPPSRLSLRVSRVHGSWRCAFAHSLIACSRFSCCSSISWSLLSPRLFVFLSTRSNFWVCLAMS